MAGLHIHILRPKMDGDEIAELVEMAETAGAIICSDVESARVVVTAIAMRKRLERHLEWERAVSP